MSKCFNDIATENRENLSFSTTAQSFFSFIRLFSNSCQSATEQYTQQEQNYWNNKNDR